MVEEPRDGSGDEPSLELPSLRSVIRRRRRSQPRPAPAPLVVTPAAAPVDETSTQPETPPIEPQRRARRRPTRVRVSGPVAAVVTGALVGLALVGLTASSQHLCTTWRGTSSCGKPGILLLLGITVVVTALAVLLLRLLGATSAGSTGLLGVGLLVVLVLLAVMTGVDGVPAVVVVPLLSTLTHEAAWWLTTTYDEPGERLR